MRRKLRLFCCFLPIFLILLSGCSPLVKGEQTAADRSFDVQPGHSIGQSFVAGYGGLSGIDVLLAPGPSGQKLTLSLYSDALLQKQISSTSLTVNNEDGKDYFRFSFPPLKDSNNTYYYFEIQGDGNTAPAFYAASGDVYLEGALYQDRHPQDAQLAFRLVYDPLQTGLGLLKEFLGWAWILLLAGVVYVLPGWALLSFLLGETWALRRWAEKLALSAGVGLALYPALMLWAGLVHLQLGGLFGGISSGLAVIYMVWKNRADFPGLLHWRPRFQWNSMAESFVFVALLAMIFFVRFWTIRGIDAPMWGDSYQHTVIAQLIADNGGLFASWHPYAPYHSLTVQYGFPAGTAVWMWLTGMSSAQATLLFGQLLNGLAILTLYPLAVQLSKGNRWAGNASLLIGGMLSNMPAYYVNWGRYAQLMGEAVLPVALCLTWYWLETAQREQGQRNRWQDWRPFLLNGLVITGMLLSYYRMAFYYAAFLLVLLVHFWTGRSFRKDPGYWKSSLLKLVGLAAVCLVLIAPWISHTSGSYLSYQVESGIVKTSQSALQNTINDYQAFLQYRSYVPIGLVILAAASLLVSLAWKRWEVASVVVWMVLVSLVRAAALLHFPGANMMVSFAVMISLYIFASLSGAWLVGWLAQGIAARFRVAGTLLCILLFLAFAAYGALDQRKVAEPKGFAMVTRPDLRAMDWINSHTAREATFLVEGFRVYSGTTAVGSDGGWWIPLLTTRLNTMPPQYALGNERPDVPDYSKQVVDLVSKLEQHSPVDSAIWSDFCRWGITHIYIGQQQGKVSLEKFQLFSPELSSPDGVLQLVYAQDRVRIYSLSKSICQGQTLR